MNEINNVISSIKEEVAAKAKSITLIEVAVATTAVAVVGSVGYYAYKKYYSQPVVDETNVTPE